MACRRVIEGRAWRAGAVGDPRAIAHEAGGLLRDKDRRTAMSDNATGWAVKWYGATRRGCTCVSFEAARRQESTAPRKSVAARESGYRPYQIAGVQSRSSLPHDRCDGNLPAREFYYTESCGRLLHGRQRPGPDSGGAPWKQLKETPQRVRALAATYAAFLDQAFDSSKRRFHNFLSSDRCWLDEQGSEDCHGRAIWALGTAVGRARHWSLAEDGRPTFLASSAGGDELYFATGLGIQPDRHDEYLGRRRGDHPAKNVRAELTGRLMAIFDQVAGPTGTGLKRD